MTEYIDSANWRDLLDGFSKRNRLRGARFETFKGSQVVEEEQEARLENITLTMTGVGAPRVTITRLDKSTSEPAKLITTISRVRRIRPQLDVDDNDGGLEIEDMNGVLNLLRLGSKAVGGNGLSS